MLGVIPGGATWLGYWSLCAAGLWLCAEKRRLNRKLTRGRRVANSGDNARAHKRDKAYFPCAHRMEHTLLARLG